MIVLVRAIAECATQIEFVLAGVEGDELANAQQNFVGAYFADAERDGSGRSISLPFRQGEVHKVVGKHNDEMVRRFDLKGEFSGIESEKLRGPTLWILNSPVETGGSAQKHSKALPRIRHYRPRVALAPEVIGERSDR
jgi:hypothetical protein